MKRQLVLVAAMAALLAASPTWARGGGYGGGKFAGSSSSGGSHYVRPHIDKNGNYVEGHRQTNPNDTKQDNWSSKGNTNPDTGKDGTKDPD